MDKYIYLHRIDKQEVACAFKNYRNPRVKLMCLFLCIQKIVTMAYLLNLMNLSNEEYLEQQKTQITFYKSKYY